jgi:pimeloyl-ACP methyl ester carboxylesterase
LAAEFALRHPDRVRKMALVTPLGLHVPGVEVPPVFGALAPRGVGGFGEARQLLFADPEGAAALEALPDGMADDQQLRWFGGLAGAARLGWKAPHFQSRRLAERISRIAVPTLVVGAEQDLLVPEPMTRAWVDGMAQAELVEVPDTGHAAVLETPDVAAEVIVFLARA